MRLIFNIKKSRSSWLQFSKTILFKSVIKLFQRATPDLQMIWVLTTTCLHSNHSLHNMCASTKETKTILSIRFPEYTLKKIYILIWFSPNINVFVEHSCHLIYLRKHLWKVWDRIVILKMKLMFPEYLCYIYPNCKNALLCWFPWQLVTAETASEVQELLFEGRESCYHTHSSICNVFMKAIMFS